MSVLPVCPIARQPNIANCKSQDVIGTANAPIGYKLHQGHAKRHTQQYQQHQLKQYQQNEKHQQHQYGDINGPGTQRPAANPLPRSTGTSIIPMSDERGSNEASRIEQRELQNFIKTQEFVLRTDKMITVNRIREFVEQGISVFFQVF